MELNKKKKKIVNSLCAFALALMMVLSSFSGLIEVKAEGVLEPTINKVFYGATTISGAGVQRARVGGKLVRGEIHVELGNNLKIKASSVIKPSGTSWKWVLPENVKVEFGDFVKVYQTFNGSNSETVTINAEPSMNYNHKSDLRMPSGEIWIEQTSSNIVSEDERAEAIEMLKKSNPSIENDFNYKETEFSIDGTKHAYYEITYTDGSVSEKIEAINLAIKQVTETSQTPNVKQALVTDTEIVITFDENIKKGTKIGIIGTFTDGDDKLFCPGNCKVNKTTVTWITVDTEVNTVTYTVADNFFRFGKEFGIIVKEYRKFASCIKTAPKLKTPKVGVKDPRKITDEEKNKIADTIREANKTANGASKLPNGTSYDVMGIPAFIEVSDDGMVRVISPNDVEIKEFVNRNPVFAYNSDGTVKVKPGRENNVIHFDKPEELLSNLAPDTPKMENKNKNIVITPNIEVDTDAKKVIVEYKGEDGSKKTITATKTDTGWTVDNDIAKVDENGVVTFPSKEVKSGTIVSAYVVDNGGLVPEEAALDSTKAELKIENKYKVTYDPNGGEGTMPEEEVNVGAKYRIKDNKFTAPAEKEFDHWMIGFEPKNPGDDTEINNDIVIKAIWKYIINPTASEVETTVGHPVSYQIYKNAIKDFPTALTVEHIKVITPPGISKVGGTQAKIEVRFSDGQFRTIPVTVNVKEDPKDKQIEDLNKKVDELNKKIAEKDGKITELNGNITDLEKQLKACQEQCAVDKAQCEKDKKALQEQINTLAKEKSNLEIQVKENRELIEQLRSQITDLKQQVEDWKKIAGDKDAKIKEHENSIKELNTKLEAANNANTELKEKLATANQKITDLESRIKELEGKVTELEGKITELGNTIKTKDTEIKTLNDTITTLKEKIAKLETEKAKDKETYIKDKAEMQEKLDKANQDLKDKTQELDRINTQLEQAKKDLNGEKVKNTGLTEKVTNLEEQIKALKGKLNTAAEDLKTANNKILELEKQVTEKETENKTITEQVEKLGKDLEAKTAEVKTLTDKVTELEKQVSEKTAQGEADKAEIERLKAELEDLKNKLKTKSDEADNLSKEIVTLKETIKTLEGEKKALTENVTRLETEVKELKETIKTSTEKIVQLEKENSALKEANKNLNEKVTELTEKVKKVEDENTTLKTKIDELNKQLVEAKKSQCDVGELNKLKQDKAALEAKLAGKDELIQELRNQIAELKKSLTDRDAEYKEKIKELEEKINNLTTENTSLKEQLSTANQKISDLEVLLQVEKDKNKQLEEENENNKKEIKELENAKKTLEEEKAKIEEKSKELENKFEVAEKEKEQLAKDKETLEAEVERLKKELAEKPDNCPTCDKKELEDRIAELEKTIENQKNDITNKNKEIADLKQKLANSPIDTSKLDKQIADLNERIKELQGKLADKEKELNNKTNEFAKEKETWQKEKDNFIRDRRDNFYWRDYSCYPSKDYRTEKENNSLKRENADLIAENKKLREANRIKDSISQMEEYVTVFYLDEILYKTFLGREFLTQAEMTDSKGYIKPFVSNNRTMLPIRYLALSLGMDVSWDQKTRMATFSNYKNNNVLNRGSVTINADTLEMKDQNGRIIYVDAKPVLINGRFYVSITNVTRAFGGSNGNINDGVKNTIEWNSINKEVLVYKNIK